MENETLKKTVLYEEHQKCGGKIVEFGGFLLPIEYTGITNEHLAVRNDVGLFDVSHMGEIEVKGKDATFFLNYILTCNTALQNNKRMAYSMMLYPNGTIVDDLMAYKYDDNYYLLVVNASNTDKDYDWILSNVGNFEVTITNKSNDYGQLALQGPNAYKYLLKYTSYDINSMKLFDFDEFLISDMKMLVSRSGYTGEDGFEIYGKPNDIVTLFKLFVKDNVTLCGLGARDTLRFEGAMPLYGHEISDKINPIMATLNHAVSYSKDFIGKEFLIKYKENPEYKLVGLELIDRGIARADYEVVSDDEVIGYITTGYMVPGNTKAIAMAYLKINYAVNGNIVYVRIRKNLVKALVRDKKFMNKKYIK